MKKVKTIVLTCIFVIFIFTVSAACIFTPDKEYSLSERRYLAKLPEISKETITSGEFMKGFETYAADQFPMRDGLRGVKAFFSTKILGKADNNGLFFKNGHISKIDTEENEFMTDYSAKLFKTIIDSSISGKNANIYFSIVPDKNAFLAAGNGYPSIDYDGFIARMKEKTGYMEFIDITPLLSLNDYYSTDTHWKQEEITDVAEFLAKEMGADVKADYKVNTLENPFYGVYAGQYALPVKPDTIKYLTNDTIDSCTVTYYDTGTPVKGDMYNMKKAYSKDPYEMFLSGVAPLIAIENPNATTDKELVLFRDSFGSSLAPLMAEGYKKITVVDIRYIQSSFVDKFVDFENCDVLFLYSTALLNNSTAMK